MAQAYELQPGNPAERPAAHGHGVGVVEENGVWAKLLHVTGDLQQGRDVTQSPENSAGSHGIGDALVDPVFQRNFIILAELLDSSCLEHNHDIIGAFESFTAVCGGSYSGIDTVVLNHALNERMHFVQARAG